MQTVKPYVKNSGDILHVYLGGTHWCVDDTNGPGNEADTSKGQADVSRARADTSDVPDNAETDVMGHGKGAETYLSPGGTKRSVRETDSIGSHADALTGQTDALGVEMNVTKSANETVNVRKLRIRWKTQNLLYKPEIATAKPIGLWRAVSADDIHVYIPLNAPVAAPSRNFVFGQVESRDELIVVSVEGERAGGCDGRRNGGSGDDGRSGSEGGTTSGGSIDSVRVNEALLAVGSQHMRQTRRTRDGNIPVSSGPPIKCSERPYRVARRKRQHGRIKTASIKVSQTQNGETTHLERARATQLRGNHLMGCWEVHRTRRQRGRMKIGPKNIS